MSKILDINDNGLALLVLFSRGYDGEYDIREIRLSEWRFYQKITDIYATSPDYNPHAPTTRDFFAKVRNNLHYAIHGHTAAELIRERADSNKEHMGLSTCHGIWMNSGAQLDRSTKPKETNCPY